MIDTNYLNTVQPDITDESATELYPTAVDPYSEYVDPTTRKMGISAQKTSAAKTDIYGVGPFEEPGRTSEQFTGRQYIQNVGGPLQNKPPSWQKSLAMSLGMAGVQAGVGYYTAPAATNATVAAAYQSGLRSAIASGAGETAASETASRVAAERAESSAQATNIMSGIMGFVSGYRDSPYGAMIERETFEGYSPGYLASDVASIPVMQIGARRDEATKRGRGERIGMIGMGGASGAISGVGGAPATGGTSVVYGAIGGGIGGYMQENPYSGKRGPQEAWSGEIRPMGEAAGRSFDYNKSLGRNYNLQELSQFQPVVDQIQANLRKGGTIREMGNLANLKESITSIGSLGGGGKKPPAESELKRDVRKRIAERTGLDYQIRQYFDFLSRGRESEAEQFVLGGLQSEGRTRIEDERLPTWISGKFGKGDHPYDFAPYSIGGKPVASEKYAPYFAALHEQYKTLGGKDFYDKYIKGYDPYTEGGTPVTGDWHGHELYSVPTEIAGRSFSDMFPDLEVSKDLSEYAWLQENQEV